MLLVRTYVAPAGEKGLGLFSSEFIPKGKLIWELDKNLDRRIPNKNLSDITLEFLNKYGCLIGDEWEITLDNDRFVNHSDNPNTETICDIRDYALRDIQIGEEITIDYRKICDLGLDFENKE